jgi:hypothetical protein
VSVGSEWIVISPFARSSDDPLIPVEAERHPFKVVEVDSGSSGVGFGLSASGHPRVVSPEDVGAHVLRYLLDMTANYLGHRQVHIHMHMHTLGRRRRAMLTLLCTATGPSEVAQGCDPPTT